MFTFGLELEFHTNHGTDGIADMMRTAGFRANSANYSATSTSEWLVKLDGSVSSGVEVVSPVLSLSDVGSMVPALCNVLQTTGNGRVSRQCGLHVHVAGFGSMEARAVRNVSRRFVNFEDTLDLLQPLDRRGANHTYAGSNSRVFGADPVTATKRLWEVCHEHGQQAESAHARQSLVNLFCPRGRYYKLNLHSLMRHGTVEFRHHAGTIDGADVVHWVSFLDAFTRVAMEQQRLWKRPEATPETHAERFRKMTRGVPAATVRHLRNRANSMPRA